MFRFTIREMFLVVVIVALGVGWWVDHRNMQENFQKFQVKLTQVMTEIGVSAQDHTQGPKKGDDAK